MNSLLPALLTGRVCVMGIGNRKRGDDGAGPRLIDTWTIGTPGLWLDAGVTPENILEKVVRMKPDTVLIVDAVAFGGSPGERRLLDVKAVDHVAISTHSGSLRMVGDYLAARTGARICVVAIQPKTIGSREGLSQPVEDSVLELAADLSEILNSAKLKT